MSLWRALYNRSRHDLYERWICNSETQRAGDLEVELLNTVCKDAVTEQLLQDVEGEQLTRGSNKARDARLDIHARGFWEP